MQQDKGYLKLSFHRSAQPQTLLPRGAARPIDQRPSLATVLWDHALRSACHSCHGNPYTPADQARCKISWTKSVCKAGQVRVSLPSVLYGFFRRRCRVGEGDQFDDCTSSTYAGVCLAYAFSTTPETTVFSSPSAEFGVSEYVFPPTVRLTGLGYISDAFLGGEAWTALAVIQGLKFGSDH